jgi:RHS repeat-associated protein
VSYTYDGLGNRITRTASAITTRYLLDLQAGLTEAVIATTTPDVMRHVHVEGDLLAQKDPSGNWEWHLPDGLGSIRSVISNAGAVLEHRHYHPYGGLITGTMVQTQYGFTGEPFDPTAWLVYLRARYYRPLIGAFVSRDAYEGTMIRPMSRNRYSWVEGNPVNRVDPSGMIPSASDIRDGRVRYSCNCGWIDRSHVDGGIGAAATISNALSMSLDYATLQSLPNFRVLYMNERFPNFDHPTSYIRNYQLLLDDLKGAAAIPFLTNFKVLVPDSILRSNYMSTVGLGIYMQYEERFESFQANANSLVNLVQSPSGFSEEDLPSDLMGYWLWMNSGRTGLSESEIWEGSLDRICNIMSVESSLFMYQEYTRNGLSNAFSTNWREWRRRPRPVGVNCPDGIGCQMCGNERWPDYLEQLVLSASPKRGSINLTAAVGIGAPLPQDGWYELSDNSLNHFFSQLESNPMIYTILNGINRC